MSINAPAVEFVGPFRVHKVVVGGREVPFLKATPLDGGRVALSLDHRWGLELTVVEAERFVPYLAHAIAIALGYTCHPTAQEEPLARHPFPRVHAL